MKWCVIKAILHLTTKNSPWGQAWSTDSAVCGVDLSRTNIATHRPRSQAAARHPQATQAALGGLMWVAQETRPGAPASKPRKLVQDHVVECRRWHPRPLLGALFLRPRRIPWLWVSARVAEPGCRQLSPSPKRPTASLWRAQRTIRNLLSTWPSWYGVWWDSRATPHGIAPAESQGTLNQGPPGCLLSAHSSPSMRELSRTSPSVQELLPWGWNKCEEWMEKRQQLGRWVQHPTPSLQAIWDICAALKEPWTPRSSIKCWCLQRKSGTGLSRTLSQLCGGLDTPEGPLPHPQPT